MNSITHFLTGYLIARVGFKKKNDSFLPFFMGVVAMIPDIDEFLHMIIPIEILEHAVFTHTIIGAFLVTFIFSLLIWIIGRRFLKESKISLKIFILAALAAVSSHLIIDIFTYREDIFTTNAHLYFWPLWNLSFHLNAFFYQGTFPNIYLIRVLIEVIYTAIIGVYILFYQWLYKKENPFLMFSPAHWLKHVEPIEDAPNFKKTVWRLFIFSFIIIGLMISSSYSIF